MKQFSLIPFLAVTSLFAVTLRQDYLPLAVGNSWHYSSAELISDYPITHTIEVIDRDDTSFTVTEWMNHPLMDFTAFIPRQVTLTDDGIVYGFREGVGLVRNAYYVDDFGSINGELVRPFSVDTFALSKDKTLFSDIWGFSDPTLSSSPTANNTVLAPGIGMIGYQLDLSTDEYPETGHEGYQLDSATLVETPMVSEVLSYSMFASADSSFEVSIIGDSSVEINYTISQGLGEQTLVSNSYNQLTNTLRIWIADTTLYTIDPIDTIIHIDTFVVTPADAVVLPYPVIQPGGYFSHQHRIDHIDLKNGLTVQVFYRSQDMIVYAESDLIAPEINYTNYIEVYNEKIGAETAIDQSPKMSNRTDILRQNGNAIDVSLSAGESGTLFLENLRGQVISRYEITGTSSIPLHELSLPASGVYLMRLTTPTAAATQKISIR